MKIKDLTLKNKQIEIAWSKLKIEIETLRNEIEKISDLWVEEFKSAQDELKEIYVIYGDVVSNKYGDTIISWTVCFTYDTDFIVEEEEDLEFSLTTGKFVTYPLHINVELFTKTYQKALKRYERGEF